MWGGKRDEGFESFFRQAFPRAVAITQRILDSRAAAEDVAAEAMARAYADWRSVRELAYREAWVLRVASNLALDAVRRRRPEMRLPIQVDVEEAATERVALAAAMRALPRRQREIVALRHLAGMSEAEVAGALGLAPGTVKSHGHRAMTRLRASLGDLAEGRAAS
ncbi:MAG: sigma-70 family RNA polymerase sigma factor [Actinomycetota bacterium]